MRNAAYLLAFAEVHEDLIIALRTTSASAVEPALGGPQLVADPLLTKEQMQVIVDKYGHPQVGAFRVMHPFALTFPSLAVHSGSFQALILAHLCPHASPP